MYEAIKDSDFRIPVENPEYKIERYNSEKGFYSYSHWNSVFKQIQAV